MKWKTSITVIILATLALLVFNRCDRDEGPVDYREKYTGQWQFNVIESQFNMADTFYFEETFQYVGEIALGQLEDEIIIHYLENDYVTLAVDDSGLLSGFNSQYSFGEFEDLQHLDVFVRWGGLGGGGTLEITGTR